MARVMILSAALLLAACGSKGDEAAAPAGNDTAATPSASTGSSDAAKMTAALAKPCEMIGDEAIAAATGAHVDKFSPIPSSGPTDADATCAYTLKDGGYINLDVTYRDGYFDAGEVDSRKTIAGDDAADVSGVGDRAFWSAGKRQLNVYRGGSEQFILQLSEPKSGDAKTQAIALAKAAGY